MSDPEEPRPYSSPPCFLHELEEAPCTWEAIKYWRTERRNERILQRLKMAPAERKRAAQLIAERLRDLIAASAYPVLGIYWPIRGEIDMRGIARRHIASGGRAALPVVVTRNAPVEFWQWNPGMRMRRGLWNIPIPCEAVTVVPHALLVPMVGFDRSRYRLGYGGGYYDRTLAAALPHPLAIGICFADAQLPTIYPQAHDIPMDVIVTDQSILGETRIADQQRPPAERGL